MKNVFYFLLLALISFEVVYGKGEFISGENIDKSLIRCYQAATNRGRCVTIERKICKKYQILLVGRMLVNSSRLRGVELIENPTNIEEYLLNKAKKLFKEFECHNNIKAVGESVDDNSFIVLRKNESGHNSNYEIEVETKIELKAKI